MNPYLKAALVRSGLTQAALTSAKRLVFGAEFAGLKSSVPAEQLPNSELEIRYLPTSPLVSFTGGALHKPLERFDFAREWNNRGYGAIGKPSESAWDLSGWFVAPPGAEVLASIFHRVSGEKICDYAFIYEHDRASILWFNRKVGPIDGYDWSIVENFYSDYRAAELPCFPVLREIPSGFESAVTMRIDCDEAVASGRQLFEVYATAGIPFGLAVKTQQSLTQLDRCLMSDVIQSGGTVCSHSHTHAPNWGGSRDAAIQEIRVSHEVLKSLNVPGINYDYVVSPFHQNPTYAVEGLRDAGIRGFVAGIICNDPEYLMARGGQVPNVNGIISHSQQCMFHGDSVHSQLESLDIYEQAFRQAKETSTFFGYLDHPFSDYNYGWRSEAARLETHARYLAFLGKEEHCWFASLEEAMSFQDMKSSVFVQDCGKQVSISLESQARFEG
ncbi:MAG: polysaccharide deacetylase [Proteobacteria bacterium]|nr:MAG: polysaccharide deacetylase [Pseudomonadota bacterium]